MFVEETKTNPKKLEELEDVIARAIKKIKGKKDNDLCKYIPMKDGGYMHHFTLDKMKNKNPEELGSLINKFILNPNPPLVVPPKPRLARGLRKKRDQLNFTRLQLERLLSMATMYGDKEMISILSPRKSLAQCKRELIQSIRDGSVDSELWNAYVESVKVRQAMIEASGPGSISTED